MASYNNKNYEYPPEPDPLDQDTPAKLQQLWAFERIQKQIHETAVSKGWWETDREMGTLIALCHSELGEATEADRKNLQSDHIPEFLGIEEEFADVIIRILDIAAHHNLRVIEAMFAKMEYNKGREHRHGGKKY